MAGLDALDRREQLVAERDVVLGGLRDLVVRQGFDRVLDERLVGFLGRRLRRGRQVQNALGKLAREVVLSGGDLALELVAPGTEHVGPRLHRVLPTALAVDVEAAGPPDASEVRVDPLHVGLLPVFCLGASVANDCPEEIVAVAEDVGLDGHGVPDAPLGGIAASVDGRGRILDDDARAAAWPCGSCAAVRRSAWLQWAWWSWAVPLDGRWGLVRAADGDSSAQNIRLRDG